jgi:adenosylmethionine-8-amino-7-oxononanoate aminotransferase
MVGVELVADREMKTPFAFSDQAGYRVTDRARQRGLIVRPIGNVVIFMPPLSATDAELSGMVDILIDAVTDAESELAEMAARRPS